MVVTFALRRVESSAIPVSYKPHWVNRDAPDIHSSSNDRLDGCCVHAVTQLLRLAAAHCGISGAKTTGYHNKMQKFV